MKHHHNSLRVLPLHCSTQQYAWGKVGEESTVAQLQLGFREKGFKLDPSAPYAELWMGTHPSGPSSVNVDMYSESPLATSEDDLVEDRILLSDWIKENPTSVLGKECVERFGSNIPFLFKVLSVKKSLSIQAHPDKELARKLHKDRPDLYQDDNHKPEMTIALTQVEALCGFRTVQEIYQNLLETPELCSILPPETVHSFCVAASQVAPGCTEGNMELRQLFEDLMNADGEAVRMQLRNLIRRITVPGYVHDDLSDLVVRLHQQHPGDVGIFCCYLLNYFKLEPGEGLFLAPNEPHAYLSGDMVEWQSCSNNVVRAGMTPKYKDVDTLCSMMTYKTGKPEVMRGDVSYRSNHTETVYSPPIDEFQGSKISVDPNVTTTVSGITGPSVVIVMTGEGSVAPQSKEKDFNPSLSLRRGYVFFVSDNQPLSVTNTSKDTNLVMWRANVNAELLKKQTL